MREFYKINNIEINSKKSKLIVIITNKIKFKKEDQLAVIIDKNQNKVYIKKKSDLTRYFEV